MNNWPPPPPPPPEISTLVNMKTGKPARVEPKSLIRRDPGIGIGMSGKEGLVLALALSLAGIALVVLILAVI